MKSKGSYTSNEKQTVLAIFEFAEGVAKELGTKDIKRSFYDACHKQCPDMNKHFTMDEMQLSLKKK